MALTCFANTAQAIDVRVKTGSFTTPATTGNHTITGVGFQPKAVILYGVPVQDELVNVHSAFHIGFAADSTAANQKITSVAGENGVADTLRQQFENRVLSVLLATTDTPVAEATLNGFTSDGFTLNYSVTSVGYIVHYIAFGGTDLQAVTGQEQASTSPVTGLPFQPDLVFVMGNGLSPGSANAQESVHSFGVFDGNLNQWWLANTQGANNTVNKDAYLTSAAFSGQLFNSAVNWTASISTITSDGFTWTGSNADVMYYLALNLGGLNYKVGTFTKETTGTDGVTQDMPDLGFIPQYIGLASAAETDMVGTTPNSSKITIGGFDGGTQQSITRTDITATTNADMRQNDDYILGIATTDAAYVAAATASALVDSTPTLTWSPNNTSAYHIGYFAIEAGSLTVDLSGTVYTDAGVTTIGSGRTISVSLNGTAVSGSGTTDAGGHYTISGITVTSGDLLTLFIDDEVENGALVTYAQVDEMSTLDIYQNHLMIGHELGGSVTNADLVIADNSSDADITSIYSLSGSNLTVASGYNTIVKSNCTFDPGGNVTSTNAMLINGSLYLDGNQLSVSAGFTVSSGGALRLYGNETLTLSSKNFSSGSNVIFTGDGDAAADNIVITTLSATYGNLTVTSTDGTTETYGLSQSLTINNSFSVNSGKIDFNQFNMNVTDDWTMSAGSQMDNTGLPGITINVGDDMNLTGAAGNLITLTSSSTWMLNVSGTGIASYVNVSNSDASGGNEIIAFDGTNTNGGGNLNWNFSGVSVSGTVFTDEGSTNIGINKTVAISIDGAAAAATDDTDASGNYVLTGLNIQPNDVLSIYLDNEAEDALAITVSPGTDLTNVNLYQNRMIIRQDATGNITNSLLATADNNADADITGFYSVSGTTLTGNSPYEMYLDSSVTYVPGGRLNVHDIDINGTLDLESNLAVITGSFDGSTGTFTSTNRVIVSASGTETFTSGSNSFNDLNINDDLVMHFKFDETSSATCLDGKDSCDESGYNRNGQWSGATSSATIPTTKFANVRSLDLNGTSAYVQVSSPNMPTGDFSIAAWINMDTNTDEMIVMVSDNAGSNEFIFRSFNNRLETYTNNTSRVSSAGTIPTGWSHVAVTRTGGTIRHYINGTLDANTGTDAAAMLFDSCAVLIGTDSDSGCAGSLGNYFDGRIDDLRIYDRALSTTEVQALARGTMSATSSSTIVLEDDLDVDNDLVLNSGTLDTKSGFNYGIYVGGDWNNYGGIFNERSGTVTLDGTNQNIPREESFFNLVKNTTTTDILTIGRDATVTIQNNLDLSGDAGNYLTVRSSSTGTRFSFNVTGASQIVSYLDVQDSNALGNDINAQNSINSGNNDDAESSPVWIFDIINKLIFID